MTVRLNIATLARVFAVLSLLAVVTLGREQAPRAYAAGPEVRVAPVSATVAPGGSVTVDVEVVAPVNGLGSWNIEVAYTASVIASPTCQAFQQSFCNATVPGAPNTIRIVGTNVSGVMGTFDLASLTFQAVGAAGTSSVIDVTVVTFTDKEGTNVARTVTDGLVAIPAPPPDLSVTKTHAGTFTSGGAGSYTITVANAAGAGPTTGPITVTDNLPAQFGLVSVNGSGWDCSGSAGQSVSCARAASLAAGASAPAIALTVSVACVYGGTDVTNTVTVTTPGEVTTGNNSASDPTSISACTVPPTAPTNFRLGTVTATAIQLLWNDTSSNETKFQVIWRPTTTPVFTTVELPAGATSWSHTGLGANQSFFYWVQSCIGTACSTLAGAVTGSTAIPALPSGLHVSATSTSSITLTWNKPSVAASAYQVVWSPAEAPAYTFVDLPGDGYSWTHAGLNPGRSYYYWVRACNTIDCSGLAGSVGGISAGGTAPALPGSVRPGVTTDSSIQILWNDTATTETSYQVVWSKAPFNQYTFISLAANATVMQQDSLPAGETRYYWVRSCISLLCSDFTNAVGTAAYGAPAPPSGLTVGVVSANTINLSWADNATNETAIEVVWNRSGTGAYITQSFPPDTRTWAHGGLSSNTTYFHWVRACRGPVCSAYTNVVTATTGSGAAPGSVLAAATGSDAGRSPRVPPPDLPAAGLALSAQSVPPPPKEAPHLPPPTNLPFPAMRGRGGPAVTPIPPPPPPPGRRANPTATPTPTPSTTPEGRRFASVVTPPPAATPPACFRNCGSPTG